MQYALLIYEDAAGFAKREDPASRDAYWASWMAYSEAVTAAGIIRGGTPLHPSTTGTTVKVDRGQRHVQDGPYADTKEQLGGFFIVDVPNLDAALDWAAKAPNCVVEVRPVLQREMPAQASAAA